jgi:hypothetical protein
MYPFPANREVCPRCQAIRARPRPSLLHRLRRRLRHGLPYGWWKSPDVWAFTLSVLMLAGLGTVIFATWFRVLP